MSSITQPHVLARLIARLEALRPDTRRRWGTLTPGEMLCHLGDATNSVVIREPPAHPPSRRPLRKWIALRSPLPWPRGVNTIPSVDPRVDGTRPGDFEADRRRAIEGLRTLLNTPPDKLSPKHTMFGRMNADDWYRWAYRHTDHHLRQFGL